MPFRITETLAEFKDYYLFIVPFLKNTDILGKQRDSGCVKIISHTDWQVK